MSVDRSELIFVYKGKRFRRAIDGLDALSRDIRRGATIGASKALRTELRTYLKGVASELAMRHSGAWPTGTTSTTLSKRSGKLLTTIKRSVFVNRATTVKNVVGTIGGNSILKVHEFGTVGAGGTLPTIVPRRAQYLTIPLKAALTNRGVPKKRSARDWPDTFRWNHNGNKFIAKKIRNKIVPLYLLRKRVDIPPRLGMRRELERGKKRFISKAVVAMRRSMARSTGGR